MSDTENTPTNPNEDALTGEEEQEEESSFSDACPDYGSAVYWDNRYTICPQMFDWYQSWGDLMQTIAPFFEGDEIVLNIGCGNSPMAVEMADTFETVVNIDISSVVIDQMESLHSDINNIIWLTMDCTHLEFDDGVFDYAFDKGTIDALMCGEDSTENVNKTLSEAHRVLSPGGLFFEITYGRPENRMRLFESAGLDWKLHPPLLLEDQENPDSSHFLYIFEKPFRLSVDVPTESEREETEENEPEPKEKETEEKEEKDEKEKETEQKEEKDEKDQADDDKKEKETV